MIFNDRYEAALRLVDKLKKYKGLNPLVLAIPRGAVPMAKVIAKELNGDFDVILIRKLRSPINPEFALGSVDETGLIYLNDSASYGVDKAYIETEKKTQMDIIKKRRMQYRPIHNIIDPVGRIVIVVDDGLATGSTMISALHGLRNKKISKLVCAIPVSPPQALYDVAQIADEVVCLQTPSNFRAVSQYYSDFPQVSDEEVIEMLKKD